MTSNKIFRISLLPERVMAGPLAGYWYIPSRTRPEGKEKGAGLEKQCHTEEASTAKISGDQ
jgi:hypothetical protein